MQRGNDAERVPMAMYVLNYIPPYASSYLVDFIASLGFLDVSLSLLHLLLGDVYFLPQVQVLLFVCVQQRDTMH